MKSEILDLTLDLLRRQSVTPEDAGCQDFIANYLTPLEFQIEHLPFGSVRNLWARRGTSSPLFVFAGHTDVVPPGPVDHWTSPPFEPTTRDGYLFARGAADMKSSIAAMLVATRKFLTQNPNFDGSLAFLITSDEEGDAIDGTRAVVDLLQKRDEQIDYCVVGEPSSSEDIGDTVRIGRRGSLSGLLRVTGSQGHVAYPRLTKNPVHELLPTLHGLTTRKWDDGNESFDPTSFQISNVQAGVGARNVIPGELVVDFNFRFSTEHTVESLQQAVHDAIDGVTGDLRCEIDWTVSGQPFLTKQGHLIRSVVSAIESEVGRPPQLSTSGGTSDGRFIAPTGAEVVELGPVNATIHKTDECVAIRDLQPLMNIYSGVLDQILA